MSDLDDREDFSTGLTPQRLKEKMLTVRMSQRAYDDLFAACEAQQMTVSEAVRSLPILLKLCKREWKIVEHKEQP